MQIQWFPGHMTKTRRMIENDIKLVDIVFEIIDARIPIASRNPDIDGLTAGKPRLIIFNKIDLADDTVSTGWERYFKTRSDLLCPVNSESGEGFGAIQTLTKNLLKDKLARDAERGIKNRTIKIMIVGIPNVGKSSFINRFAGKASTKTGDRPGVTKGKQWITLKNGFDLLDTPGILWPKFDDEQTALHLAFTGAIKDEIMDTEELACHLVEFLAKNYKENLKTRYKISEIPDELQHFEILELIGRKRGFVVSGGEIDLLRTSNMLLDEFRSGKLGRISLESPENIL